MQAGSCQSSGGSNRNGRRNPMMREIAEDVNGPPVEEYEGSVNQDWNSAIYLIIPLYLSGSLFNIVLNIFHPNFFLELHKLVCTQMGLSRTLKMAENWFPGCDYSIIIVSSAHFFSKMFVIQ